MADDEIKDLMRGLLLTLPDALPNQVASERKHGYSIRLLSTERVAHAPLGKRLAEKPKPTIKAVKIRLTPFP